MGSSKTLAHDEHQEGKVIVMRYAMAKRVPELGNISLPSKSKTELSNEHYHHHRQ